MTLNVTKIQVFRTDQNMLVVGVKFPSGGAFQRSPAVRASLRPFGELGCLLRLSGTSVEVTNMIMTNICSPNYISKLHVYSDTSILFASF